MFPILDECFDDCFDYHMKPDYSGPCDDDCEYTAPYVGILPDESGKVNGSPLRFYRD